MSSEPGGPRARRTRMRLRALTALVLLLLLASAACGEDPSEAGPSEAEPSRPPSADTEGWQRLPDAPLAGRTGASVVGVGSRAYVFGGWEFLCPPGADCAGPTEPPFADGAVVDLETGEWRPIADAPQGMAYATTAVLDGDLYVVASCISDVACTGRPELLRYDTAADTWTELGPLPARAGGQLLTAGHGLLVLAGTDESGERDDVLYTPETGSWTALPDDPLPRSYDRSAVVDGERVLLLASPMVESDDESQDKVAASYDLVAGTWTRLPPAPGPGYQTWRAGDRAFLNPHYREDGGGVLDLRHDTWGPFPAGPDDPEWRGDLAGLISEEGATYEYSEGWVFDARDDEWVEVPPRGGEVYDDSVGAVGQTLVVFGGQEWEGRDGRLVAETLGLASAGLAGCALACRHAHRRCDPQT